MYLALIHHIPRLVGFILLWDGAYKLVNPGQATMALESLEMPYGLAKTIVSSSIIVELYLGVLLSLRDRKSTRLNSSHGYISYAVFCLKKKKEIDQIVTGTERWWIWIAYEGQKLVQGLLYVSTDLPKRSPSGSGIHR